jgi:hypothetical protein
MIINHERQFVFFHIPKTAGWSVRSALAKIPGSIDIGKTTKHLTPREVGDALQIDATQIQGYFSFCFVRDPWERFGSLHRFQRNRHPHIPPP